MGSPAAKPAGLYYLQAIGFETKYNPLYLFNNHFQPKYITLTLSEQLNLLEGPVFAFGKNDDWHWRFCNSHAVYSMYPLNFGLGIPANLSAENQLRAVFHRINNENGHFFYNICGVDLDKAITGFASYDEAADNNMITEWELSILLQNPDYLERTIFHNGKTVLPQNAGGIEKLWN